GASLTPESLYQDESGWNARVDAEISKHRREDKLPVPPALVELLKPWLKTKITGAPLWPGRWHQDAAAMLREDLTAAEIEYKTVDGYFDFHATRHTGITRASKVMRI